MKRKNAQSPVSGFSYALNRVCDAVPWLCTRGYVNTVCSEVYLMRIIVIPTDNTFSKSNGERCCFWATYFRLYPMHSFFSHILEAHRYQLSFASFHGCIMIEVYTKLCDCIFLGFVVPYY